MPLPSWVTPEHLSLCNRERVILQHPTSGQRGKHTAFTSGEGSEAGQPSAWHLGDRPIRKTASAGPRKIWYLLRFSKGRVGNRPEDMGERTWGKPICNSFPELEHWVPGLEEASGCKPWRSARPGRCPQRGQPPSPGTCSLGSRGHQMGRGLVLPGTWHVLPLGLWRIPGATPGLPVDRVTFHLLCLQAQANAHRQKSVNNYAHFIINFNNLRVWYCFIIVFISPH